MEDLLVACDRVPNFGEAIRPVRMSLVAAMTLASVLAASVSARAFDDAVFDDKSGVKAHRLLRLQERP
jgi:hypothetical protein